jgi:hypothetical protein
MKKQALGELRYYLELLRRNPAEGERVLEEMRQ